MNERAADAPWNDYLDGELPEEHHDALRAALTDEATLRRAIDQYQLHRLLGLVHADDDARFVSATMTRLPGNGQRFSDEVMAQIARVSPPRRAWLHRVGWAAAALLLIAIGSGTWLASRPPPEPVAILLMAEHATWVGTQPSEGQRLRPGRYTLTAGRALIHCDGGAQLALTALSAPLTIELLDSNSAALHSGVLVTRLSDGAHGFTLRTPIGNVVDRGTEFLVDAGSDATEVHVLTGAVAISTSITTTITPPPLVAGQALRFRPVSGATQVTAESIPLTTRDFDSLVPERIARAAASGLDVYEGFAYHPQQRKLDGGSGWDGPWGRGPLTHHAGPFALQANSLPSVGGTSGRALTLSGEHERVVKRLLATPIAMNRDGAHYLSFIYHAHQLPNNDTEDLLRVILSAGAEQDKRLSVGIFHNRLALASAGAPTAFSRELETGSLRVVVKVVTSATGDDRLFALVQSATRPLSPSEPTEWTLTGRPFSEDAALREMHIAWASGSAAVIDEVRLGSSWKAVAGGSTP